MTVTFSRWWLAAMVAIWLAAGPAAAGEAPMPGATEQAPEAAVEAPSEELLEFLGGWDAGDDEWVGPEFFQALEAAEQEQDHDQDDRD
jgi:hypothetical protein